MADLELDGVNSKAKINKIESDTGSTVTLGQSGDTVTLGSGATLGSVFDPSQTVTWSSTIITTDTTLVSGNGYFVNTTSGAITVTLPASPSVGDYLQIKDYAGTFATNNLIIARNGSNIQGNASDSLITTNRAALKLVYADATKGWLYVEESNVSDLEAVSFVAATGGTITTSGDYKIHTFTSSGTFTVTDAGSPTTSNSVDYLVVAGGGGGGHIGAAQGAGAGGGAGGFRQSFPNPATGGFPVSVTSYPITVGGGGTGGVFPPSSNGGDGSNSVFSTITSTGGGGGGESVNSTPISGNNGGSGGGGGSGVSVTCPGGSGNTPSVSPSQGNNGGNGFFAPFPSVSDRSAGGGGGASAVGANANGDGGAGGNGTATTITGSSNTYAGGGGGGDRSTHPGGSGGSGGGGTGSGNDNNATDGTANTGGGGGGFGGTGGPLVPAGTGGSGIVIIRYKFQ